MEKSPLIDAAKRNDIQTVRALIQSGGVDVNAMGSDGRTALHWAASRGFVECVQVCCCIVVVEEAVVMLMCVVFHSCCLWRAKQIWRRRLTRDGHHLCMLRMKVVRIVCR